jgi:hypothetical protein
LKFASRTSWSASTSNEEDCRRNPVGSYDAAPALAGTRSETPSETSSARRRSEHIWVGFGRGFWKLKREPFVQAEWTNPPTLMLK